jgi:hypothetical protein
MTYAKTRTKGIHWGRWRRRVVMRSLEMLVTSGVVRRAEVDPPQHYDECPDLEAGLEASVSSMPPVNLDAPGWFIRFFRRRVGSPFTHVRHTT